MTFEGLELEQKILLQPNGCFEWEKGNNEICYCFHQQNAHLDNIGICLEPTRICENFERDCDPKDGQAEEASEEV